MKRLLPCLLLIGCADLRTYEPDTCGNNVVEAPREDCDLVPDDSLGDNLSCGAAATAGACRYLCSGGASCPRGWSCFDDDICRYPTGRFDVDDEPRLVLRADEIDVDNYVGDEAVEVAGRLGADFTLYSLEADAEDSVLFQANVRTARGSLTSVPVGEEGERANVLIPGSSRFEDPNAVPVVHVLAESGDRLVSAVAPRLPISLPLGATLELASPIRLDASGLDDVLYAGRVAAGVGFAFLTPTCETPQTLAAVLVAPSANETIAPPKSWPLADGRRLVALGIIGTQTITVGTTTAAGTCTTLADQNILSVPGRYTGYDFARTHDGPALLVYLDDQRVAQFRLNGTALDAGVIDESFDIIDRRPPGQPTECDGERLVLAVGNLQAVDDGFDDFVTENGLFVSTSTGYRRAFTRTRGGAWAEAVIGDYDRDGRPDVAASTRFTSADCSPVDLQNLRQANGGTFTSSPVPNVSLPRHLRGGDFDGDGIADVALVEGSANGGARVSVFYGDTKEALEDKSTVSGFEEIRGLESYVAREGGSLDLDRLSDLVILPDEEQDSVTLLFGTPRRSLLAPIALDRLERTGRGLESFVVAAGRLTNEDADDPDLLALSDDTAWVVLADDFRKGGPPRAVDAPSGFEARCAALRVSRRPGVHPAIGIDGYYARDPQLVTNDTGVQCDYFGRTSKLIWVDVDPLGGVDAATLDAPTDSRVATQLTLADLDGNDRDEVIVQFAFRNDQRNDHAYIYWNVQREGDTIVSSPASPEPVSRDRAVLAVAVIDVDADDLPELAAYTEEGLVLFDTDDGVLVPRDEIVLRIEDTEFDDGGITLKAGEIDGDGLTDLVLLSGERLFVLTAVPSR